MFDTKLLRRHSKWTEENYAEATVYMKQAANEIERQQREIECFRKALEQYADRSNWGKTLESHIAKTPHDWWLRNGSGWEIAEKALNPDEPPEK